MQGRGPGFSAGYGGGGFQSYRIKILGYSYSGVEQFALDLKRRLENIARVRSVDINAGSFWSRNHEKGSSPGTELRTNFLIDSNPSSPQGK